MKAQVRAISKSLKLKLIQPASMPLPAEASPSRASDRRGLRSSSGQLQWERHTTRDEDRRSFPLGSFPPHLAFAKDLVRRANLAGEVGELVKEDS